MPGLFLHGIEDELIGTSHTEINYEAYGSENKSKVLFHGTHNSYRPKEVNAKVFEFIKRVLG